MAALLAFSDLATGQSICSKAAAAGLAPSFLPVRTRQLNGEKMKASRQQLGIKARRWNKPKLGRRLEVVMSLASNSSVTSNPLSPADTIKQFYSCINAKDLKQLSLLISDDCYFDDCSFPRPFQGKKEVLDFLKKLTDCMGQNVEFHLGTICEGDDFTISVNWYLEWKKKPIPFTRGCSFFECKLEGTRLVIKKAQVVIESPVKPGDSVLVLLKIVTGLFDTFPKATERFLKSPRVLLQITINIYSTVLWPFLSPFLGWYIKLWKLVARLLGCMLNILLYISKNFNN